MTSSRRSERKFGFSHHWFEGIASRQLQDSWQALCCHEMEIPPCKARRAHLFLYSPSYQVMTPNRASEGQATCGHPEMGGPVATQLNITHPCLVTHRALELIEMFHFLSERTHKKLEMEDKWEQRNSTLQASPFPLLAFLTSEMSVFSSGSRGRPLGRRVTSFPALAW